MLGIAGVVVWTVLSILAVPASIKARRQALRVRCASNLRQMVLGAMMYANVNRYALPLTIDDLTKAGAPAALFTCPACAGDPTKPVASTGAFGNYHYVYLANGRLLSRIRSSAAEPLMYEPPTNHADGGINVLFADGHVELLTGTAAHALLAQIASSTQPATSTPSSAAPPDDAPPGGVPQIER